MAVARMSHVTLAMPLAERGRVLETLQRVGCVEPIAAGQVPNRVDDADDIQRTYDALAAAVKMLSRRKDVKKPLIDPPPYVTFEELLEAGRDQEAIDMAYELARITAEQEELTARLQRELLSAQQIAPWAGLDIPMDRLSETRHMRLFIGTLSAGAQEELTAAWRQDELPVAVQVCQQGMDADHIAVACHTSIAETIRTALKAAGFMPESLPAADKTPAAYVADQQQAADDLRRRIAALEDDKAKGLYLLGRMKKTMDALSSRLACVEAAGELAYTQSTCFLMGWVPTQQTDAVREAVLAACPDAAIDFRAPLEDEQPPTLEQNNALVTPAEMVTDMFAAPRYNEMDPNPHVLPFFVAFFGMMVSDAGYGLLMAIGAYAFVRLMRKTGPSRKLPMLLCIGGVATMVWGIAFGGVFCVDVPPLLFRPLDEPLYMLGLCYGLGILHIFYGMALKAYQSIRQGRWWDALFDQGFWYGILIGIGLLFVPATAAIGKWVAIISVAGVLITGGRYNKGLGKITGGLSSLYGITGYISDILSYSRLFAMGLATGVVGMVINLLGGMLMGPINWASPVGIIVGLLGWVFGIAVLIGGHAFNLVINALGAFIHSARLQYIEFFGRFYEGGGRLFKPLRARNKNTVLRADRAA
nr:V-type ATP synthase subunit I [bacterium]